MKSMIPVIFILVLTIFGSFMLPENVKEETSKLKETKNELQSSNQKTQEEQMIKIEEQKESQNFEEEKDPIIILDAAHSPFTEEGETESDLGELFQKDSNECSEYELTYELADTVCKELKKSNIKVILLQERNKEKLKVMKQLSPDMVISLHIHRIEGETGMVYYVKGNQGENIVSKIFKNKDKTFKTKKKNVKKGDILKEITQAFIIEYNAPDEDEITDSWLELKAEELSEKIEDYFESIYDVE